MFDANIFLVDRFFKSFIDYLEEAATSRTDVPLHY
jgi:hypothetical protein